MVYLVFECSAAAPAIRDAVTSLRPCGTMVQVGVAGPTPMSLNVIVGKEILFMGSQRFDTQALDAVAQIGSGAIDPRPRITDTFPVTEALTAFAPPATAPSRSRCNSLSPAPERGISVEKE
ncbi:zinc-binding dehydrogenase [Pseudotabrizicola sediminis]|uniref:zinc-binding dehydrogenase n=1 Tax=Pseudotabrizicola sediminis TaxID=2486418 RepID=UPI001FD949A0|nr:zinc-binding dehydrogenase [Pseudotabrizicola sediminis]